MSEEVVPVDTPAKIFRKLEKDLPTPQSVADKADRDIATLAPDPRWEEIKKLINKQIDALLQVEGITEADTIETVGIKFMVSRLAVSQLKIIRDLPEAIAEGLKDGGAKPKPESK